MEKKKRVLFLCAGNSCRSQIAEGLLRSTAGDVFDAASAGSEPAGLNPRAVAVMAEIGIDISHHRSKSVDEFAGKEFDYAISLCDELDENRCPIFTGKAGQRLHVPFSDPARATGGDEEVLYTFRRVRDEIHEWVTAFARHEAHCAAKS